jgi:hypothetical protein
MKRLKLQLKLLLKLPNLTPLKPRRLRMTTT